MDVSGDGNFHVIFLLDPAASAEFEQASRLNDRLVRRAIAMDGTCTGEHGVGRGKRDDMVAEHGAAAVALMRTLKQALDPHGILNPGKVLPG